MEISCFISIRISIRIRLEMIGGRGWLGWIWMDWFVTDLTEWCFCLQFWLWYGWIMLNWYVAVVWTWSFYYMIKNNWIGGLAPMINLLFWCHQPCFLNPIQFEKQWTRPPWEVLGASRMPQRSGLSLLEVLAHGQDGNHPILVYTPSMHWTPPVFKVALWLSLSDVGDLSGPFLHVSTQLQLRS